MLLGLRVPFQGVGAKVGLQTRGPVGPGRSKAVVTSERLTMTVGTRGFSGRRHGLGSILVLPGGLHALLSPALLIPTPPPAVLPGTLRGQAVLSEPTHPSGRGEIGAGGVETGLWVGAGPPGSMVPSVL